MDILIISRGYPSEKYKMHGVFEFDQAKALAQAGHKVVFAAVDMRSFRRKRKWGFESFIKDGVQVEAVNIPLGRVPDSIMDTVSIFALKVLYKKIENKYGRPDIVHAHFLQFGYITARVFEKSSIPLFLTEHLSRMNQKIISPYLMKLGEYTYHRMDRVITVSKYLADSIKEKFGAEAQVIPNIVDTESFEYREYSGNTDVFNFVSTGSLTERKNMDLLIEAFYKAFKGNEKVRLYIFGEGPEKGRLENIIEKHNLKDNVFLMGLADRKDIAARMAESFCFVLASNLETFGVAYIEAMAMGLPVIATRCGGPEGFVDETSGIVVNTGDGNALAEAMKKMYKESRRYNRKKISENIKEKFSPGAVAGMLTELYHEMSNA